MDHVQAPASLREFISHRRHDIHRLCVAKLKSEQPSRTNEDLADQLDGVIDEIIGALARSEGMADTSHLPRASPAAATKGRRCHELGLPIDSLAREIGAISDS